jgi:hypothetical protein
MFELHARRSLIASRRERRVRSRAGRAVWVLSALLLGLSASPEAVRAQPAPPPAPPGPSSKPKPDEQKTAFAAEVSVLHATNAKKGIDARIGPMPELAKPPFSTYDSYELIERKRLPLDKQAPQTLKLPNGRTLETRLREIVTPDSVTLVASINQPNGKEFLPLLEVKAKVNQSFIVAGQNYKGGMLVLVIKLVK